MQQEQPALCVSSFHRLSGRHEKQDMFFPSLENNSRLCDLPGFDGMF
jgi:hypothetical protein